MSLPLYDTSPPLLRFVVPGPPRGAMRHRVGAGRRMYHTAEHEVAESKVTGLAMAAMREHRLARREVDYAVRVELVAWFTRPAYLRKMTGIHAVEAYSVAPCIGRIDADNLAKLHLDGMTKAGVWTDDNVVVDLRVCKKYLALDPIGNDIADEMVEVSVWAI